MLPHLANNDNESGQDRPSLPSIRELFGEQLSKPVHKRPSPFSLVDLGSSLPSDSRSSSPGDSQGSMLSSTLTSPRSAWSQVSGQYVNVGHTGAESTYSPRRHSDSAPQLLTTPSTSSSQDEFITLPPIHASYSYPYRDSGRPAPNPYLMSSSQRISSSHSRSRSSSETLIASSDASLDLLAKRRHTIGSSRGSASHMRYHTLHAMEPSVPISNSSRNTTPTGHPFSASRTPVTNLYPAGSRHPSLSQGIPPTIAAGGYLSSSSAPPSPPSTSGEEVQTERKKTPAKYECQYCKKRFNRPSSLKLHNNTHTGEKPFACPFPGCGRHFSVMSNMRRHARIHGDSSSSRTPRESSVEDNFEASPSYSPPSSSMHKTPTAYTGSHSSSPQIHSMSLSSASRSGLEPRRHPSLARAHPHPYRRSSWSPSDGSSPER